MATSKMYLNGVLSAWSKRVNWDTDDIRVMLVTSAYTPNQDAHDFVDDVKAFEVSGTGYTAGGIALANTTITKDDANNVIVLDADDATWPSSTITARYAIVYNNTGASDAARPLLSYLDLLSDQASNSGNFTVTWDATGIMRHSTPA